MTFRLVLAEADKIDSVLEDFLANEHYRNFAFRRAPTVDELKQRLFVNNGLFPVLARDKASDDKLVLLGLVLDDGPPYFEYVVLKKGLPDDRIRTILAKFLYLVFKTKNVPRLLYYLDAKDKALLSAFIDNGFEEVTSKEQHGDEMPLLLERQVFIDQYTGS